MAHAFIDVPYVRSSIAFAGAAAAVRQAVAAISEFAFRMDDVSLLSVSRSATAHPTLGLVDHIALHDLPVCLAEGRAETRQSEDSIAAAIAKDLAADLAMRFALPAYLYGDAHPHGRRLRDLRRQLRYFKTGSLASACSSTELTAREAVAPHITAPDITTGAAGMAESPDGSAPDYGPLQPHPSKGLLCIGSVPPIYNYNIAVHVHALSSGMRSAETGGAGTTSNPTSTLNDAAASAAAAAAAGLTACRRIARGVAERTGGLPAVEALALPYALPPAESPESAGHASSVPPSTTATTAAAEGGAALSAPVPPAAVIEIACNLLDVAATPPAAVLERVRELVGAFNAAAGTAGADRYHGYHGAVAAAGASCEAAAAASLALAASPSTPRIRLSVGTDYTIGVTAEQAMAALQRAREDEAAAFGPLRVWLEARDE